MFPAQSRRVRITTTQRALNVLLRFLCFCPTEGSRRYEQKSNRRFYAILRLKCRSMAVRCDWDENN